MVCCCAQAYEARYGRVGQSAERLTGRRSGFLRSIRDRSNTRHLLSHVNVTRTILGDGAPKIQRMRNAHSTQHSLAF